MSTFARAVGSFLGLMTIAYIAVVMLFPAPVTSLTGQEDLLSGRSAAERLTSQAHSLVAPTTLRASQ